MGWKIGYDYGRRGGVCRAQLTICSPQGKQDHIHDRDFWTGVLRWTEKGMFLPLPSTSVKTSKTNYISRRELHKRIHQGGKGTAEYAELHSG